MHPAIDGPHLIKAELDKIVYNITIELHNARLLPTVDPEVLNRNVPNEPLKDIDPTQ
jgi:hypothetical protein